MESFANGLRTVTGVVASLVLLSGCAVNMQVPIKDPAPSSVAYNKAGSSSPVALAFKDEQTPEDKAKVVTGTISMHMVYQDKPFDSVSWIAQQTLKEMVARGLPVTLATDGSNSTPVIIKRMHVENYRASGFSPFITFTTLRADVVTPSGPRRVTAYVKRGKVPVWGFGEVIDPTYNDALSILTKELAAKLNQQLFQQTISNEQVAALIARINQAPDKPETYLDVYQLGFGNNPTAIPELVKLCASPSEYVRQAAISSLGILKATDQMGFLVGLYESDSGNWQDRGMAIKAIGDLGTPASRSYLEKQRAALGGRTDKDAVWTKAIIELYL